MADNGCFDVGLPPPDQLPPDLLEGARNAVRTCLDVESGERVVLIADEHTKEIASALHSELQLVGGVIECFSLEHHGKRPLAVLPGQIVKSLQGATVSIFIAKPIPGELKARSRVMELASELNIRHAHMPGVDHEMMVTAMRADYHKVARLHDRLLDLLHPESVVHVRSPAGTDLEIQFAQEHRWVCCDGLIKAGQVQNLPAGQLFTTPKTVDGVYVCDAAIGDWFGTQYPDISDYPVTLEISMGRVLSAKSDNAALARQLMVYFRSNVNGDRVGEFGIGTNLALDGFRGISLQDEQVPGVHIALGGASILASTGARWTAQTHIPLIGRSCDMDIDRLAVLRQGVFDSALLEQETD